MNDEGSFFAGFRQGTFHWSSLQTEAKPLLNLEQLETIRRHEPLMDIIHEYL